MSNNTFKFNGTAKTVLAIMIVSGLLLMLIGYVSFGAGGHHDEGHGETHHMLEQVDAHTQDLKDAAADKLIDSKDAAQQTGEEVVDKVKGNGKKAKGKLKGHGEDAHGKIKDHATDAHGKMKGHADDIKTRVNAQGQKVQVIVDEAGNEVEHVIEEHLDEHGNVIHEVGETHLHDGEHTSGHHEEGHHSTGHGGDHEAHGAGHGEAHGGHGDAHSGGHGDAHGGGHGAHGDAHGGHGDHHAVAGATPVTAGKVLYLNLWTIIQMLMWMGMAAMFFLAAHTAGWAGFHIMFQKVTLGIMTVIPVAAILGAIVFALGHHDIFIWTNPEAMEASPLMATKKAFLNTKSFIILGTAWVLISTFLLMRWWRIMGKQDADPSLKHFSSSRSLAAVCIVLVAIMNAFGVWHWIMSIEPNWYSTMYAWYTMASGAAIMFAITILVLLYLQSRGYLPNLNESHYHDLGKYLFAISIFWTYVWFSQYMLIWYGNIPEETVYFRERMANYPILFYGALFINFFFAGLVLVKRDAKRNRGVLIMACILIIIGHWFDFFNMIVPYGVAKGGMGLMSVGCLLLFGGIAGFVILGSLTRVKSLDSREHPYFQESLKHHI